MQTKQYQCWAYGSDGTLVHAGPRSAARVTEATAIRWEREWRAWRRKYLRANPGEYPLRSSGVASSMHIVSIGEDTGDFNRTFAV